MRTGRAGFEGISPRSTASFSAPTTGAMMRRTVRGLRPAAGSARTARSMWSGVRARRRSLSMSGVAARKARTERAYSARVSGSMATARRPVVVVTQRRR